MIIFVLFGFIWIASYFITDWFLKKKVLNINLHSRKQKRLKIKRFIMQKGAVQREQRKRFACAVTASYTVIATFFLLMMLMYKSIFFALLLLVIFCVVCYFANKFVTALAKMTFDKEY